MFYPEGHWGIRLERPMWAFASRLAKLYPSIPRRQLLKIAVYGVARHEFCQLPHRTSGFAIRVAGTPPPVWRLDFDDVYAPAYPGPDCFEETIANVWASDDPALRTPRALQEVIRGELRRAPGHTAQALISTRSTSSVGGLSQCADSPIGDQAGVRTDRWGVLARPYVQPWTRYENVSFTMTRSLVRTLLGS